MKNEKLIPERWVAHADDLKTKVKENDKWKNLHSPSWCPVPFNTISWHPSGVVSRCMMSDAPMGDSHNSPIMQELRQNMLDGKWDTHGCLNCLQKEKNGYRSQRMNWLHNDFIDNLGNPEPYTNPKLVGNDISHLFVNFSNICNFKCRMCSSNYSNSLIPENKHMTPLFPEEYKMVNGNHSKNFNNINEYLEANPEVLDGIRSIWMTGGEPFMDDSPYKLMELIEAYGHPEKIKIVITTNGSKLDFDKLDKFNKIKSLILDISIDAVGPMFEYMRSNGVFTWSQMEVTCDKLKKYREVNKDWFEFQINSSYQLFNYDNTLDFLDFIYDHKCNSNIRLVTFPEHLRVGNLPDNFKKEAYAMCDKIELRYGNRDEHQIKRLNDMRSALRIKEPYLQTFKKVVAEQDKFRGTYLYNYHDKLAEIIYGSNQQSIIATPDLEPVELELEPSPLLRPQHKSYSVIFPEGLPGDWFAWFVNRHKGFPQIEPLQIRDNKVGHQGRYWSPLNRTIYNKFGEEPWEEKSFPFEIVIEKALEMGLGDFTKLVFKIGPKGHYLRYVDENFDVIHTEETNITNHIVLEFSDKDMMTIFIEEIENNNLKLEHSYAKPAKKFNNEYLYYKEKFALQGVSVDKIDLSKILTKDLFEYYRLCLLIDSQPLPDWKQIVDEHVELLLTQYKLG